MSDAKECFPMRNFDATQSPRSSPLPLMRPRESAIFVSSRAKNVQLQPVGIQSVADEIAKCLLNKTLSIDGFSQFELHPNWAEPSAIDELFVLDTLNFCFWSPNEDGPKWTVTYKDKQYTGYFALCAAIRRAKDEGIRITDPRYYATVSENMLQHIFRSDTSVPIPLLDVRLSCLQEVGRMLVKKFDGTFETVVKAANKSAVKLLKLILLDFPCFRDEAEYEGQEVGIYKRAQILVGDIWACFRGNGMGEFTDIDEITMFADYRVPQVLLHFGAMTYSEKLMDKLRQGVELTACSSDEVEIRLCSIQVVEMICERLREYPEPLPRFNAIMVDHFLWDYRRSHAKELQSIPFHRTLGIYY